MAFALEARPAAIDDRSMVEHARGGDRVAFGELYDRYAPVLLGTALRFLRDREAQDLVHDVFLEAWEHVREYDPARGSVRTWLLVRLRSRALDRLDRVEARRTLPLDWGSDLLDRAAPVRAETVDGIAVREALGQVEPGVREVLDLTYFGGLTAREIGDRTGVPVGTVKSRLARGLSLLHALLRVEGGPDV